MGLFMGSGALRLRGFRGTGLSGLSFRGLRLLFFLLACVGRVSGSSDSSSNEEGAGMVN